MVYRETQTRGEGAPALIYLYAKSRYGAGFSEVKTNHENIFGRMARACGRGGQGAVRAAVVDHGHPGVTHGSKATTPTDREVLDSLIQAVPAHGFLSGRFTGIADAVGCKCASLVMGRD